MSTKSWVLHWPVLEHAIIGNIVPDIAEEDSRPSRLKLHDGLKQPGEARVHLIPAHAI
jgi:hypothetical protein